MAQPAQNQTIRLLKDIALLVAAVFSAAFGLKGFLLSSHFIDGGVVGISMLLAHELALPLAVLIPVLNLPFVWLGYQQMGRAFALKSVLAIGGLSAVLATVSFPDVTPDLLLTAVFGGFFIGAGIGLAMRGGAVLDGTEIAALLISRKSTLLRVSDVILLINVVIFGVAVFLLGTEVALYSMLTYFAASKTVDFLVDGIEEYTAVMIVSDHHEAIRHLITETLGKGATVLKGEKGFGKRGLRSNDVNVIYSIVTRLEVSQLQRSVDEIDPNAFMVQYSVNDTRGGIVKSRPLH